MQGRDVSLSATGTEALVDGLRHAVGADGVVTDPARLEAYSADTYWKALAARAAGAPLGRAEIAVLARSEDDVAATLRLANRHLAPVVPWGGGSGSQGGAVATDGGIVLDLTGLDGIVDVDEQSLTVTAEEVAYLLEGYNRHLNPPLGEGDVLSAFAGLRPLRRGDLVDRRPRLCAAPVERAARTFNTSASHACAVRR